MNRGAPQSIAVVVAHPDDETLFAAGVLLRAETAVVVCCTVPRRDPVRIEQFREACAVFGATPVTLGHLEPPPDRAITEFGGMPDLREFDLIVTHNRKGEYGSVHHRSVCGYMASRYQKVAHFGYGGNYTARITLTQEELALKLLALQKYEHATDIDKQPKWKALIDRYFEGDAQKLGKESYAVRGRLPDARAHGAQAGGVALAGVAG